VRRITFFSIIVSGHGDGREVKLGVIFFRNQFEGNFMRLRFVPSELLLKEAISGEVLGGPWWVCHVQVSLCTFEIGERTTAAISSLVERSSNAHFGFRRIKMRMFVRGFCPRIGHVGRIVVRAFDVDGIDYRVALNHAVLHMRKLEGWQ
jgi:hypothetical protein